MSIHCCKCKCKCKCNCNCNEEPTPSRGPCYQQPYPTSALLRLSPSNPPFLFQSPQHLFACFSCDFHSLFPKSTLFFLKINFLLVLGPNYDWVTLLTFLLQLVSLCPYFYTTVLTYCPICLFHLIFICFKYLFDP